MTYAIGVVSVGTQTVSMYALTGSAVVTVTACATSSTLFYLGAIRKCKDQKD